MRAIGFVETVDGADVRMVQRREDLRFALEPGQSLGIAGERGRENLDGDVAAQLRVAGAIHLAHAARAKLRDDVVCAEAGAGTKGHQV